MPPPTAAPTGPYCAAELESPGRMLAGCEPKAEYAARASESLVRVRVRVRVRVQS